MAQSEIVRVRDPYRLMLQQVALPNGSIIMPSTSASGVPISRAVEISIMMFWCKSSCSPIKRRYGINSIV